MNKFKTEIKWGLIFALSLLVWMVMEKMLGWHDEKIEMHPLLTMIFVIPAFVIYYFGIREKRDKDYDGKLTWIQGVITGTIIGVVVAIISPLEQYVTHTFISPDYFQNAIAMSVETGYYKTVQEAEANFNLQSYIMQSMISAVVLGAFTGAIVSIFLKRK